MMKHPPMNLTLLMISALTLGACSSSKSAIDPTLLDGDLSTSSVQMKLKAAAPAASLANALVNAQTEATVDLGSAPVSFSEVRVNVHRIQLKLPDPLMCTDVDLGDALLAECKEENETEDGQTKIEAEIEVAGPIVFDLLTGTSTPDVSTLQIPSGVYREVEFEIRDAREDDALVPSDDALQNHSFYAAGTFTDKDGLAHPFELKLSFNEEIEIESQQGVPVIEGNVTPVVVGWNAEGFFEGIDLQKCLDDGDLAFNGSGVLVIDESVDGECSADAIKENIKKSFEFEDEDDESDDDSSDDSEDESESEGSES